MNYNVAVHKKDARKRYPYFLARTNALRSKTFAKMRIRNENCDLLSHSSRGGDYEGLVHCTVARLYHRNILFVQGSESLANGIFGESCDAVNVQLIHDLLAVGFHGFHADIKTCGYFLGRFALGNEL